MSGFAIMKFITKTGTPAEVATDCLVIPRGNAHAISEALGAEEQVRLALEAAKNETGEVTRVALPGRPSRLLIVGKAQAGSAADYRKDMDAAAKALANLDVAEATLSVSDFEVHDVDDYRKIRAALDAVSRACYRFDAYKSAKPKPRKLRRVGIVGGIRAEARRAVRHAQALHEGVALAKDLGNPTAERLRPDVHSKCRQRTCRRPGGRRHHRRSTHGGIGYGRIPFGYPGLGAPGQTDRGALPRRPPKTPRRPC